jgi:hypothetical protein
VAVFHEHDFSVMHRAWPPTPLRDRIMEVFHRFFERACCSNMGSRLWTLLVETGFENPDCRAEYPIDGGSASLFFQWFVESLRSILPRDCFRHQLKRELISSFTDFTADGRILYGTIPSEIYP